MQLMQLVNGNTQQLPRVNKRWAAHKSHSCSRQLVSGNVHVHDMPFIFLKGWMTRQIFFGLSESVCLKTYLSRIKVHTEQGV